MKFMTKKEYQRKIFLHSHSNTVDYRNLSRTYEINKEKLSLWDRLKIKLELRSGQKLRIFRPNQEYFNKIRDWLEKPLVYQKEDYILNDVRYEKEPRLIYEKETRIVNKFDSSEMPPTINMINAKITEKDYNDSIEIMYKTRWQWRFQVWCDRMLRLIIFFSVFFLSQKVILPIPNNWLICCGTFIGTILLSKLIKFIVVDSLESRDFLFWNDIYIDRREWHYLVRVIIVFFFTYAYISHYILFLGEFEYNKWIIGFLIYIIMNHIWFKYETDPDKKALK